MRKIIIASTNKGKIREFREIFKEIEFISLSDLEFKEDIIEDGNSFKENAFIKANYIYQKYKIPTIADDSGLCVRALDFAPGIYSARYAGGHDDEANNKLLIENMRGITDRYAYYEAAICYVDGKNIYYGSGICEGEIIDEARGKNGFGYDPYFYLPKYQKTMAEIESELKNKISHRYKALIALKEVLDENR